VPKKIAVGTAQGISCWPLNLTLLQGKLFRQRDFVTT
jgi:hypothetical protein